MTKARQPLKMPEKRSQDAEAWVQEGGAKDAPQATPEAPRPMKPGKPARLNVDLPADLHRQFKTACAAEGVKMAEVVAEMVQSWTAARR